MNAASNWRHGLRVKIGWLLLLKLLGLLLLWALFFSPQHRTSVTAERAAQVLAVEESQHD